MKSKNSKVKSKNCNLKFKILLILTFALNFCLFTFVFLLNSYADSGLAQVERLFLEGQYEKCESAAQALTGSRPSKGYEVYYLKGLSELKMNKFNEARQSFQAIIDKYPASPRLIDAQVGIGDSYFLEGRKDIALKNYNEILQNSPGDKNIAIVKSRIKECGSNTANHGRPTVEPRDIPRGEPTSGISVQVGSFKNSRNADKLAKKLSMEGFDSFVEIPVGSADRLYRVKVGKLHSTYDAEALAARLKIKGYKTKICPAQ